MSARTIAHAFLERAAAHPERLAFDARFAGGPSSVTWGEWGAASEACAAALIAAGHRPGDRVAILAGNGILWPVADLGILIAGGVSVGVYPTSAPGQVAQVLADSGAAIVFCDSAEQVAKVRAVSGSVPALRTLVGPGEGAVEWDRWLASGAGGAGGRAADRAAVRARLGELRPELDAVLVYTSGSTGEPKGARLSHRCLVASAASIRETLGLTEVDTALSFLPYSHASERVFGLYTRILCGMSAALVRDHNELGAAARAFGPTVLGGLPRFFEKACESLRAEERAATGADAERWSRVLELGRRRSLLRRAGGAFPAELEAEWRDRGGPLFARLAEHFGGRVRLATSGGAAFPLEVAEYLDALGMTVLGAYGLTEHLCGAFNRPDDYAFDSAGPPMPGTEITIAADGEILIRRCDLTFSGYHGRPGETRAAFTEDGRWLKTGDLGAFGPDGRLRVTGRKKELIALSTGKKVAPLPIEARLVDEPLISQAVLYGEGRKFVSALLALRRPAVEEWARQRGLEMGFADLLEHPDLVASVQEAVDRVNATVSRPETVRRFIVLERELSVDHDELTPTLKVRRPVVTARYGPRLDTLYNGQGR